MRWTTRPTTMSSAFEELLKLITAAGGDALFFEPLPAVAQHNGTPGEAIRANNVVLRQHVRVLDRVVVETVVPAALLDALGHKALVPVVAPLVLLIEGSNLGGAVWGGERRCRGWYAR